MVNTRSRRADKEGYSAVREALEKENYAVADLNLLQQAQVPADAAAVIIAGPEKPLFPQEIDSSEGISGEWRQVDGSSRSLSGRRSDGVPERLWVEWMRIS